MQKLILVAGITLLMGSLYFLNESHPVEMINKYESWKKTHGKIFNAAEDAYRFTVYQINYIKIRDHNSNPSATYKMGENQFMALTPEEFQATYLTAVRPEGMAHREREAFQAPKSLKGADWRGITTVKDQGQCGSCWAFSAVGAVETFFAVRRGQQGLDLSESQLVDCDHKSYGCNGGYNNYAIQYAADHGLTTEAAYPYAPQDRACQRADGDYRVGGVEYIPANRLYDAIAQYPVSVLVDASNWSYYSSGVFGDCNKNINHAVLAVGFRDDGVWIIKNSWSAGWGESGYINLAAGDTCGVTGYGYRAV